jgi:hypothetical protein
MFSISTEGLEIVKLLFFKDDLVAITQSRLFYYHEDSNTFLLKVIRA